MPTKKKAVVPSRDRLRLLLHYNPMTGIFTWRNRAFATPQWNGRYAGKVAGCKDKDGYIIIGVDGDTHFAHRLAWVYMFGWNPDEIDHEDHDKSNNKIGNLRDAGHWGNMKNTPMQSNNTSGRTGVYWHKPSSQWRARIKVSGKHISLGLYNDFPEACRARDAAEAEYEFHKNHGLVA